MNWLLARRRRGASRLASVVVALLTLAGASDRVRADSSFQLSDTTTLPPIVSDQARIVIAREQFVRTTALRAEPLYLDGAPLGVLPQRAFIVANVAPGRHCVAGFVGMPTVCLDCRAGRDYFLRLRETIDDNDHLLFDWVREEPARVAPLIAESHLKRATTTPKGMKFLAKRISHVRATATPEFAPSAGMAFAADSMWYDDPLDTKSLRASFKRELVRVSVDPAAITVTQKSGPLVVPFVHVTRVHFGGVRYGSLNPWLDVEYDDGGTARAISLADSRLENSAATYNRLFGVVEDQWRAHGTGISSAAPPSAADTLYTQPPAQPR